MLCFDNNEIGNIKIAAGKRTKWSLKKLLLRFAEIPFQIQGNIKADLFEIAFMKF